MVRVEQPRDRRGSFEPQIVPKHRRRFAGFDDRIVAMYARGMSVRAIQAHLREALGVEVGHDLMSWITDAILGDAGTSHGVRVRSDQSGDPSERAHPRGVRPSRRSGSPI